MLDHCFLILVLDALSSSAIIFLRKMAGCFTLIVFWLSVSLPLGAVCPFAICDCDISWSYSLVERICLMAIQTI